MLAYQFSDLRLWLHVYTTLHVVTTLRAFWLPQQRVLSCIQTTPKGAFAGLTECIPYSDYYFVLLWTIWLDLRHNFAMNKVVWNGKNPNYPKLCTAQPWYFDRVIIELSNNCLTCSTDHLIEPIWMLTKILKIVLSIKRKKYAFNI